MAKVYRHAFDPAQDGYKNADPKPARFEIQGASWPQAWWQSHLTETEEMLKRYIKASREGSNDLDAAREQMLANFLSNALKIAQTLERGYVEQADWEPYKKAHLS